MVFIIGHRGAMGIEPENTLRSIGKAIELGVGMVEFDVRVCRTGEAVLMHDASVRRTTGGSGLVRGMSLAELRRLDAGMGERIPTLHDALDAIGGRVQVNIELKGPAASRSVLRMLEDYVKESGWSHGGFLISSFSHGELGIFRKGGFRTGFLFDGSPKGLATAEDAGAFSINLPADAVTDALVDDAHSRGLQVFAWVVNSLAMFRRLKSMDVDGVFTDLPDMFIKKQDLDSSRSRLISCRGPSGRPSGRGRRVPEAACLS